MYAISLVCSGTYCVIWIIIIMSGQLVAHHLSMKTNSYGTDQTNGHMH